MHHHDDYLLSTINAKGKGYSSLIFKQGYDIDKTTNTATVELEKYVPHTLGKIEFIDCHTAHTIFYPESLTMTYGLWSSFYPTTKLARMKKNPIIQKNKRWIKKAMSLTKVNAKNVGVAQYREDYFYPKEGKIKFLSGQVLPKDGEHFLQNFFHIAKEFTGFQDTTYLKELYSSSKKSIASEQLQWVEKAIENESIQRNYQGYEMYVDKRNVSMEEYKKVYNF